MSTDAIAGAPPVTENIQPTPGLLEVTPPSILDVPAPAPEQPPVLHSTPAEQPPPVQTGQDLGYTADISDPAVKGIVNILVQSGVRSEVADALFKSALETGNPADLDEENITKVLGDNAPLVIMAAKGILMAQAQKAAQTQQAFMSTIGGENAWGNIKAWVNARESVDPEFKVTVDRYRALVNEGSEQAILVANALKGMYSQANITRKPDLIQGTPLGSLSTQPINDSKEFGRLYSAAINKGDAHGANEILARWRVGGGKGK